MNILGEFAKSTISRAIGHAAPQLPFSIGQKSEFQMQDSIWTLYDGMLRVQQVKRRRRNYQ
jgi:hypothetical protein